MRDIVDLGRASYDEAYGIQLEVLRKRRLGLCEDTIILLEHESVITLGRTAKKDHLLMTEEALKQKGIELRRVDRGGDITYHGPGQLVCYLIVDLKKHFMGLHSYLRSLEEVVIRALNQFGITGERLDGLTGVWVGNEKIASIGIGVKGWVSYHGICINVDPNWEHLNYIVSCGLHDREMTSIKRVLRSRVEMGLLRDALVRAIGDVFGCSVAAPEVAYA